MNTSGSHCPTNPLEHLLCLDWYSNVTWYVPLTDRQVCWYQFEFSVLSNLVQSLILYISQFTFLTLSLDQVPGTRWADSKEIRQGSGTAGLPWKHNLFSVSIQVGVSISLVSPRKHCFTLYLAKSFCTIPHSTKSVSIWVSLAPLKSHSVVFLLNSLEWLWKTDRSSQAFSGFSL